MNSSNGNDDLSGVRILLIEDAWHLGKVLKDLLRSYGAEVAGPAASSADAQRLASEQPPDVALVDFSLRNGERADVLIDRLNEQGIYVIVMSGHDVLPVAARRAAAGDLLVAMLDGTTHGVRLLFGANAAKSVGFT